VATAGYLVPSRVVTIRALPGTSNDDQTPGPVRFHVGTRRSWHVSLLDGTGRTGSVGRWRSYFLEEHDGNLGHRSCYASVGHADLAAASLAAVAKECGAVTWRCWNGSTAVVG